MTREDNNPFDALNLLFPPKKYRKCYICKKPKPENTSSICEDCIKKC